MPVETIERDHDEGFDMLSAVAEDILAAVKAADSVALKNALAALVDHIQSEDVVQDEELAK